MGLPLVRGLVCAIGAGFVCASSASAFLIQGSWTQEADVFVLPDGPSAGEVNAFLVDAFPIFEGGAVKAAALAGQQAAQSARITYGTYSSDGTTWTGPAGILGELSITLRFNPLATGGTQDITTGGEYIDKQLAKQQKNAEFAQVDVDKEVWRQDFGQVKADRHTEVLRDGTFETFTFSFRGLVDLPPGALDVDPFGQTEAFTIEISVVEVPGPAAWLGVSALGLGALRRRRNA